MMNFYFLANELLNTQNIITFLVGVLTGFTLFFIVILILVLRGKKESKKIYGPTVKDFSEEKIREMILNKQNDFIREVEENDSNFIKTTFELSIELLHEISSYYYPNSKYPEYELTITEAGDLIHYIVNQIVDIFDKPVLKNFKNVRISTIASSIDKTKKVQNNKAIKTIKDSHAGEVVSGTHTILNTLNPIYWFKKIVIKGTLNVTLKKVCKAGISIIGHESNKVYSKNLFKNELIEEETKSDIEEVFNDEEN